MSKDNSFLNGSSGVLLHKFNPNMSIHISMFVVISVALMIYACLALFLGLQPFSKNNPFDITSYNELNVMNFSLLIVNVAVAVGMCMFVYTGSKDIMEQRVLFD